jgi:hypothetical protein
MVSAVVRCQSLVSAQKCGDKRWDDVMGKLNPTHLKSLNQPGRHMDGDGLMLEVKPSGAKSWVVNA